MNKAWIVIITIVITVAVVGGGAYYYLNNKAEEEKAELENTIDELEQKVQDVQTDTSDADSSATTTEDETADWQTYTNEEYGFSFKYPADWEISKKTFSEQGGKILTLISPETAQKIADRTNNPFTLEDITIRFSTMPVIGSNASNTINVWMADMFTDEIKAYGAEMQGDPGYYAILVQADNGLFALDFGNDITKKSELSLDVKNILLTFQFNN